ncbi:MAG: hypothetical protein IBJ19_00810 [Gemmatimonadaceae bacterium]|nr:hypothetical protein [Gemmatimonadaceae bacterium]
MGRPPANDREYRNKRDQFSKLREQGKSIRTCAELVGIATSVAQTWEADRRLAQSPMDHEGMLRAQLEHLNAEGFPEEAGRASQIYWRVRLGAPPPGANAWHTEHLAIFVSQQLDVSTPEELFASLGEEGRGLWLEYLAAMGRRAGLRQRDDGTWFADPDQEPPSRA